MGREEQADSGGYRVDRPASGHDVGKVAPRQVDRLVAVAAVVVVKAIVVGVERDAGLAQGLLDLAAQGELGEGDRADPEQCIAGGAARFDAAGKGGVERRLSIAGEVDPARGRRAIAVGPFGAMDGIAVELAIERDVERVAVPAGLDLDTGDQAAADIGHPGVTPGIEIVGDDAAEGHAGHDAQRAERIAGPLHARTHAVLDRFGAREMIGHVLRGGLRGKDQPRTGQDPGQRAPTDRAPVHGSPVHKSAPTVSCRDDDHARIAPISLSHAASCHHCHGPWWYHRGVGIAASTAAITEALRADTARTWPGLAGNCPEDAVHGRIIV